MVIKSLMSSDLKFPLTYGEDSNKIYLMGLLGERETLCVVKSGEDIFYLQMF